jgi:RND family efflux transporter MFP subunit
MKKIRIIAAIVIVVIGAVTYLTIIRAQPQKKEVKTVTVEKGTLKTAFSIDGKTSVERRDLKFTVSGKVTNVAVKEGQTVTKGQLLIALDVQDVQKNLDKSLKDYLITRNTFDQTGQVTYPAGALSDTIKRLLENSQYTLDKSVLDVEIKNIAFQEAYLYSPIEGVVSTINIKDGETTNTQSAEPVIIITKPESLAFESYAEDTDILKINKDQKTTVSIDAIPNIFFPSQIDFISNLATTDENGLATYKVRVLISDLKGYSLVDGMAGKIEFITKEKADVLIIPNTAVFRKDNRGYVLKMENGNTTETPIESGFTDGKGVEIISGLKEGDVVVIP